MTKILLASVLAFGFATSAFATDSGLIENGQVPLAVQQYKTTAANAYAYAPLEQRKVRFNKAERHEFDRVPVDEVSSR